MYKTSVGTGRYQIDLIVHKTVDGLVVVLTGGEVSHVGGVVLAVPRNSTRGNRRKYDVWNTPVPGHLDNEVGLMVAIRLCECFKQPISVTSGVHIDNATREEILALQGNCEKAVDNFIKCHDTV